MEFVYWPADTKWELPSIEMDSLYLLTYIKFTDDKKAIMTPILKSLLQKKGRVLPCLRTADGELLETKEKIVHHLKLQTYDLDDKIKEDKKTYILPLTTLIEDKLYPAVIASLWLDDANYNEVTRPTFAKHCRYPLNFTYPKKMRDDLEHYLRVFKSAQNKENLVKALVKDGVSVLQLFSGFLQEKDYLFGDKPSSVDALLFSCIAPLLKIRSLVSPLCNEVQKTSNLTHYVNRILQKFSKKEEKLDEAEAFTDSKEDADQKYDWVFPVCIAGIAMFSYAANAGLLEASK